MDNLSDEPSPAPADEGEQSAHEFSDLAARLDHLWPDLVAPEGESPPPLEGRRIARYDLVRVLGSGAFGVVYLAYNPDIDREVALKIPLPGQIVDRNARRRFLREARAAGILNHPNIITIYESGEAGAFCYIASEYFPAKTLAEWLADRSEGAPVEQAVEIVRQLAEAVEHAHKRGVIHRDLKPGNVLLGISSECEGSPAPSFCPRIIDFGLAYLEDEGATLTRVGDYLGTTAYMSPEQASGRGKEVTPATDIFSLGIILFELLTKVSPFERGSIAQTLAAISQEDPRLKRHCPHVPRNLEAICLRALAKDPARRYSSAGELSDDLQRFLNGIPVNARHVGPMERMGSWCRRHRALTGLIAVTLLAAFSFVGLLASHSRELSQVNLNLTDSLSESEQLRSVAEAATEDARQQERMLQQHLYDADLSLAYKAWEEQDLPAYENLLLRHYSENDPESLRVEWRFLWRLGHPRTKVIAKTGSPLYDICLSPTEDIYAVAAADGVVRIYDPASDKLVDQFPTGQGEVNSVSFSPDGQQMATAGDDGTVRIWNWHDKEEILVIKANKRHAFKSLWLPDGKRLVSCGEEPTIYIWNAATGEKLAQLQGHKNTIQSIRLSPDRKLFASASSDRTIVIWDIDTYERLHSIKAVSDVNCLAFAPEEKLVFAGMTKGEVQGWNYEDKKLVFSAKAYDNIHSIAVSPTGEELLVGDARGVVHGFNLNTSIRTSLIKVQQGRIYDLEFLGANDRLLSCGLDGHLKSSDYQSVSRSRWLPVIDLPWPVAVGEDFLAGHGESGVYLIGTAPNAPASQLASGRGWKNPQCSARNEHFFAARNAKEVRLWDARTGELAQRWELSSSARSMALSYDSKKIAVADSEDHILIFDCLTGNKTKAFDVSAGSISLEFSPDDHYLAYVDSNNISLLDLQSGHLVRTFQGAMDGINGLEFSPGGTLLAAASGDRIIHLWDVESGNLVAALDGHQKTIRDIHFVADGETLISHDTHGFAFWDIQTKRQLFYHEIGKSPHDILCRSEGPPKKFYGVVVSPQGKWMAVSTSGKSTYILDLDVSDISR